MRYIAAVALFALVAVVTLAEAKSVGTAEEPVAPAPSETTRDKRGVLLSSAPYTALAYTAPVAYSSYSYPYAAYAAYSSLPYYSGYYASHYVV